MSANDSLSYAKDCLNHAVAATYPEGFKVCSWWRGIQDENRKAIRGFNTAKEAVEYAQWGAVSGFDHRVLGERKIAEGTINYKIAELEAAFPEFSLQDYRELRESDYSRKESLVDIGGIPYSTIFFTHLNFYLRTMHCFAPHGKPKRVLEIGAGYGGLARIYKTLQPHVSYVIVDLPESLFSAHVFLSLNFPDARITYAKNVDRIDIDAYDFVLVPVQFLDSLRGQRIDVVINTGSLQEMPDATVQFWMRFIQEIVKAGLFYSWNYFLTNKRIFRETSGDESNLICPVLDPYWTLKYFRINTPAITVDCAGRNWLEVCVERVPRQSVKDLDERAESLYQKAQSYKRSTNHWFAHLWMAIWCRPKKMYISELLSGIADFANGKAFGIPNYNDYRVNVCRELPDLIRHVVKDSVKGLLGNVVHKYGGPRYNTEADYSNFNEIQYYETLMESLNGADVAPQCQ